MKKVLLAIIRFYRAAISPYTKPSCKYIPTCSEYGLEAIERFGALKGSGEFCAAIRFQRGDTTPYPKKRIGINRAGYAAIRRDV